MQSGSETLVVAGVDTGLTYQWLGHVFQTPHRLFCQFFMDQCKAETYSESGVSSFVQPGLDLSLVFLNQSPVIGWMMFATVLLPMLALILAGQAFVGAPISCTATVAAVAFACKKTTTKSA